MSVYANMKYHLAELCQEFMDKKAKVLEDALEHVVLIPEGYTFEKIVQRIDRGDLISILDVDRNVCLEALKEYRGEG